MEHLARALGRVRDGLMRLPNVVDLAFDDLSDARNQSQTRACLRTADLHAGR